ncbi:DUF6520 family protein [Flavobacterium aquidurense]|uniref:DUF6520 family protein n=1 Tax=Flavobacterium aquidurense TaxID=362413 RepID=UPI0006D8304D|nr:DUF6520 family protein [Flavobacterium aquidurense]
MKMLFFKNGMPIATAVLAIALAFATSSMQSASKNYVNVAGFSLDSEGFCDISVECSDIVSQTMCRVTYPNGPMAFGKNFYGMCLNILWKSKP